MVRTSGVRVGPAGRGRLKPLSSTLATAMLGTASPPGLTTRAIVVGPNNNDPYPEHEHAIRKLGEHFGVELDRLRCYPYSRR
jgi:hypothetical protein